MPGLELVMQASELTKLQDWLGTSHASQEQAPEPWHLPAGDKHEAGIRRTFLGGDSSVSQEICQEDKYEPSAMELAWVDNVDWVGTNESAFSWMYNQCAFDKSHPKYNDCVNLMEHCKHMPAEQANAWIQQNVDGKYSSEIFSKICRKGEVAHFIEPLAGLLRDPRFYCPERGVTDLFSVDWIVLPTNKVLPKTNVKARFYDAGGSRFNDGMPFFLETYRGKGITFDEVYVWEYTKQGTESYWEGTDPKLRAFWEPRVTFYDGVGVTAEKDSRNNPVSRIFSQCKPEDYCVFKLDIDNGSIENPLAQQLLQMPEDTRSKLDEFFFEHHVTGVMQSYWSNTVDFHQTFADSRKMFMDLRKLGVRAHSWV
jgi:hypothetical protein